jgi:hypothetical protein
MFILRIKGFVILEMLLESRVASWMEWQREREVEEKDGVVKVLS